eukprot:6849721-Pyramimonas_sp.AAC.1
MEEDGKAEAILAAFLAVDSSVSPDAPSRLWPRRAHRASLALLAPPWRACVATARSQGLRRCRKGIQRPG